MRSRRPRGRLAGVEINPEALRQARLRAGLSLAQVGSPELTRQAIHLFETGKVRPSVQSLQIVADRLGVPESALLADADDQTAFEDSRVRRLEDLCLRHEYTAVVDRARQLLARSRHPRLRACAHHYLGLALYQLWRLDEALGQLQEARHLFESLRDDWHVAESMDWEAMVLHGKQDGRALRVAKEALRWYRELRPRRPEVEARLLEHIGTILAGRKEYDAARAYYDEALRASGGVRDLARIARIDHGLAICYIHIGDHRRATDLLLKALALYEAEQRISGSPPTADVPQAENDLGMLMMSQGDLDRAEEFLQASMEHYADTGVDRLRSNLLLSVGELRQRQGRLLEALAFVAEAIDLAERLGETRTLITGHRQLGELHAARGAEPDLVDEAFRRALALSEEMGLDKLRAECQVAYERALAVAERRRDTAGQQAGA